ncbi:S-layer homology domain-containing protein [Leptolyngbya sp. AN02str]|uniref:S-layer homology domain-containing protein n=1 Tax=Leptolyngbya sp. AN02str TaxID=3423363 RepID=UPI003D32090B
MRRLAEAALLTLMLACIPAIAQMQPLVDPVQQVVNAGLMTPAKDGQFREEAPLSRAELARILVKTFELEQRFSGSESHFQPVQLADVPVMHWAYADIQAVLQTGLMTKFPGDRFLPDQPVTRAEGFAVIAQASQLPKPQGKQIAQVLSRYADANQVPAWAKDPLAVALSNGLVNWLDVNQSKYIAPQQPLTRGDAARSLSVYLNQRQARRRLWDRSTNSSQLQPRASVIVPSFNQTFS